jgi:hypothetical protein
VREDKARAYVKYSNPHQISLKFLDSETHRPIPFRNLNEETFPASSYNV